MAKRPKLTAVEYGNGITNANTPIKGMFYFSATGPAGMTCNMCRHAFDAQTKTPKARCQLVADYCNGKAAAFDPAAPSCKRFEGRETPLHRSAFYKFSNGAK